MLRHMPFMILILISSCDNRNHRYQESVRANEIPFEKVPFTTPVKKEFVEPELDKKMLEEGLALFNRTCVACHGPSGAGDGVATAKGLTPPLSFMDESLIHQNTDYFINIMTNGHGRMSSVQRKLDHRERYKVAHFIKALQLSRRFPAAKLNDEDRRKLP